MSPRNPKESAEQRALVQRLRSEKIMVVCTENSLHFPVADLMIFLRPLLSAYHLNSFKNQLRSLLARLSQQRLSLGQYPGYPDLFLPELRMYIEMKVRKGGVCSEEQLECHKKLEMAGYLVIVAHGAAEAWEEIKKQRTRLRC